jgi:glucose-1-phosphate adenylyltransferase
MAFKQKCIAMLLAGGQGSRLGVLTKTVAKPAVPYGGKYRIIDFPLSNCVNSGIFTVGVLTQYQPLELNDYIGNGEPWDLDRKNGGVHILPPYQKIMGSEWYKNTANAIYQNIHFIDKYDPEYVVILSGDHIYKMDYSQMLSFHEERDAACTIAMIEVGWDEASRFGLMVVDDDGRIKEFEEKPKKPSSNKASMGVYMFTWEKLRKYLLEDEANPSSGNDFGHDLIPAMHNAGERLYAYQFDGYWRDVGTVESLWASNLDLLTMSAELNLDDPNWKIYSRSPSSPPQYISNTAVVKNSMLAEGCHIEGTINFSVLFANTKVEPGALIMDSIIMPGCVIKKDAVIKYSIVAQNTVVEENASVGSLPTENKDGKWGITVIGPGLNIGKRAVIGPDQMIESDVGGV